MNDTNPPAMHTFSCLPSLPLNKLPHLFAVCLSAAPVIASVVAPFVSWGLTKGI